MSEMNRREFLTLASAPLIQPAIAETRSKEDFLQTWLDKVSAGDSIPFSFDLSGQRAKLRRASSRKHVAGTKSILELEFREETQPLLVLLTCEFDKQHSLVRNKLRLTAKKDLEGSISRIAILDLPIEDASQPTTRLFGISGGFLDGSISFSAQEGIKTQGNMPPRSLRPFEKDLRIGERFEIDSDRTGRSSNSQTPLWVFGGSEGGYWLGPEWSGCWHFEITRGAAGSRAVISLPTFDFNMRAGEQWELPVAAFGAYQGDIQAGCNQLRRVIAAEYLPRVAGKKPIPPVIFQGLNGLPKYQDEAALYKEADRAAEIGCEAFVFDAGWNQPPDTEKWWEWVGNWRPDETRFPHGFGKFVDHVHARGMRLGLWIEPRASIVSEAYKAHPELFLVPPESAVETFVQLGLKQQDGRPASLTPEEMTQRRSQVREWIMSQGLLDLSQSGARALLLHQLESLAGLGADWIWFDYNIDPRIAAWDGYEQEGRKGLMELGFYQGLYQVFDTFLQRHPDVWLESCASGGRIIDLAMLRRSHSIWVNDVSNDDDINRNLRGGANSVLPAVYVQSAFFVNADAVAGPVPHGTPIGPSDRFLTCFGGVFQFGQGLCFWNENDLHEAKRYVGRYKEFRKYLQQDFYRLLPMPSDRAAWDGWQYHDPATDSGMLLLFRMKDSAESHKSIRPRAVDTLSRYRWSVALGGATLETHDRDLVVAMSTPSAALIHYSRD